MNNVTVKVYGHLYPVQGDLLEKLELPPAVAALNAIDDQPALSLDGAILRLSFEGAHFPMEEFMENLRPNLSPEQQGKFDCFDLDEWRLARWLIRDGRLEGPQLIPINNAMEKIF